MKNTLATLTLVSLTFAAGMNAQSRRTQVSMAGTGRMDLNTTLVDLDRVSQATQSDIASMHVEKWKAGWKTGFLKDGAHKDQAQQAAGSLQRNMANALPALMRDVQASHGSITTTFKLYDDVSLLCEAVDSLIAASEAEGKKTEAATLTEDYSALARIRRSLSNYIQQASVSMESRSHGNYSAAVAAPATQPATRRVSAPAPPPVQAAPQVVMDQGVKKIIVDDTVPDARPAAAPVKKKPATTLTNLE